MRHAPIDTSLIATQTADKTCTDMYENKQDKENLHWDFILMHSLWLVIVATWDWSKSSSVKALDKFISRTGSFLVEV